MHDYIFNQLATERATTLRDEASAQRVGKRVLARRAHRRSGRVTHHARRSARVAR